MLECPRANATSILASWKLKPSKWPGLIQFSKQMFNSNFPQEIIKSIPELAKLLLALPAGRNRCSCRHPAMQRNHCRFQILVISSHMRLLPFKVTHSARRLIWLHPTVRTEARLPCQRAAPGDCSMLMAEMEVGSRKLVSFLFVADVLLP